MSWKQLKKCLALLEAIVLFVSLLALDLGTKFYVARHMRLGESIPVIPGFFHFTYVHNRGAAFSIGTDWSRSVFVGISIIALALLVWMLYTIEYRSRMTRWAAAMILSGALANLFDRLRLGYVVDFLDVFIGQYHWPVFNVADSAITVGAILLGITLLRSPQQQAAS